MFQNDRQSEIIREKIRCLEKIYEYFLAEMEALKKEQDEAFNGILKRIGKEKSEEIL